MAELSRKHGFPEVTLYTWKSKYGGEDVSESKRLRDVQAENTKLKKLLAERHGRVENMKICLDAFSEANEIKDEMLTLKECGLKGRPPNMIPGPDGDLIEEEGSVPTVQVFYDFKPLDYSDPIMLHFNT